MKTIIDIPDNQYNQICELRLHNRTIYDDAIRNGIPLDKIRAEIRQIVDEETEHDETWARGLHYSLCIIDKYRKEQE
jgi:hypothetical protein